MKILILRTTADQTKALFFEKLYKEKTYHAITSKMM
jgi:hypothetical protein